MKKIAIILSLVLVSSCVHTRSPEPIAMEKDGDTKKNCQELGIEYNSNTVVAREKIQKNKKGDKQDILLGVLVWPGLADFKNADGTEGNALLDRNVRLMEIAKSKKCKVDSWTAQPGRYK